MNLKFTYVLTCAPDKHYIEWVLISLYSLRRIHPEAYTILLVDDKTDAILTGGRALVLDYVSEKIVVDCPSEMNLGARSRYIKTSIRQHVSGDFIYLDCDTVVCTPLDELDYLNVKIGAIDDNHLLISEYNDNLYSNTKKNAELIGLDLDKVSHYHNGGVLLARDCPEAHALYDAWHSNWLKSFQLGCPLDEPSLALADVQMGQVIQRIPQEYDCITYTQPAFFYDAKILHISSIMNECYLFSTPMLDYIRDNGLTNWVKWVIEHAKGTILTYEYLIYHSNIRDRYRWKRELVEHSRKISENMPQLISSFPMHSRFRSLVIWFMRHRCFGIAAFVWMFVSRMNAFFHRTHLKPNVIAK